MADGKAATGWTDEMKLVFLVHLFDSGAATIDWSKATLPPGKKMAAVKMMMKRLADSYRPQLDKLSAGGEAGDEANNAKPARALSKKAVPKGKTIVKDAEAAAKSDGDDEVGQDSGKMATDTAKTRSRAPRVKATNSKVEEDEDGKRGRKKTRDC
ncbi:hypothetical protein UCDDS831_g00291 [Diplodia seriata]|uniref:Uncharacterized protein n=1 Tax=Diplodia seriata TaxID=420778 RepID=A0A0G2F209_9PEZI|nr:hypothetical protein UCDDS831_g00291 [Diplodia seriata]